MASDRHVVYGGQAVLEGVMIRGHRYACVAVRRPDGSVALTSEPLNRMFTGRIRKLPILRGILILIETLVLGMKALTYSANVAAGAEGEEIGKRAVAITLLISLSFAVGLFFIIPILASRPLEGALGSNVASNVFEGVIRLAIFLVYIYLIGKMDQIKRVFMYHGAEHMTVHAQEAGVTLDVASVRKYPTAHPRCGTAFLLVVMVIAVLVFAFTSRESFWWLIGSRVVLIPLIAALSYEVIRFSGTHFNNPFVRMFTVPSLVLQGLTTRQPDSEQIEIAIAAMSHALESDGLGVTEVDGDLSVDVVSKSG